jgi:mercuric reductase
MPNQHDIVILGSGSTAFAAALRAHSLGARVLMIEKSSLGGTCINWGCIPSKTMIQAAQFYQEARLGARLGLGSVTGDVDFTALTNHRDAVVKQLRQSRYLDVLHDTPGLELVRGTGRFIAPGTVEVGEQLIKGDKFLIATGGLPRIPAIPGLEQTAYLTSRSALLLKTLPKSLVIIGGGAIALELGQMYHRLGTVVTILEHGPRLLPGMEAEPVLAMAEALVDEGMTIVLNTAICAVARQGETIVVEAEQDGRRVAFSGEQLLLAVGTAPASTGIGLENTGVEVDAKGFIKVDEQLRTTAPGIWAAGDVVGGMMIATVGAREGIVAVDSMLNPGCGCAINYQSIPMAIFTDPEVAVVGYSEEEAREAGFAVITNTMPVSAIPKAHVTGQTWGAVKMVAEAGTGRLLGVHLSCQRGADVINEAALAIRFKLTVEDLANTLHVYPSIGEGLRLCAQGFSRDISKLSCCAE